MQMVIKVKMGQRGELPVLAERPGPKAKRDQAGVPAVLREVQVAEQAVADSQIPLPSEESGIKFYPGPTTAPSYGNPMNAAIAVANRMAPR